MISLLTVPELCLIAAVAGVLGSILVGSYLRLRPPVPRDSYRARWRR